MRHTAVLVLGFMLVAVVVACGDTQPLPDIDVTVETRVAEERAKVTEATVEAIVETTVQAVLTADNVLFPDASLDAAIREALGKAVQDKITTKELAKLVKLDCRACGILDLTGLEYASNLTTLELGSNQISDVSPLASLTSLDTLGLFSNQISDVSNDIQALRNRGVKVTIGD